METKQHFKELASIVKNKGIYEAIVYDFGKTWENRAEKASQRKGFLKNSILPLDTLCLTASIVVLTVGAVCKQVKEDVKYSIRNRTLKIPEPKYFP